MGSNDKIEGSNGSCEKARVSCPHGLSTSHKTLTSEEKPRRWSESSLPDASSKLKLLKFGSASAKFKRMTEERDEVSWSVNSSSNHNFRERISVMFSRKIEWACLMKMGKQWLRNPFNIALFLWIFVVAVLWCDSIHGYDRWKQDDVSTLRKIYCENGTYKPNEWIHMMVVVLLIHLNCFAQYALCGLNLGLCFKWREARQGDEGLALSLGDRSMSLWYMRRTCTRNIRGTPKRRARFWWRRYGASAFVK